MLNIGPQELLLILVVALVIVGPQRLPQLARGIAGFLRSLRAAQDEVRRTVNEVLDPATIADATGALRSVREDVKGAFRQESPDPERVQPQTPERPDPTVRPEA